MDNKTLKQIARKTLRPCPEIVPALVAVRLSDGFRFSPYGAIPWECKIERNGYVYRDARDNTTYGKQGEHMTEHSARRAYVMRQLRNAVRFLKQLRAMTAEEQESQANYWLKQA